MPRRILQGDSPPEMKGKIIAMGDLNKTKREITYVHQQTQPKFVSLIVFNLDNLERTPYKYYSPNDIERRLVILRKTGRKPLLEEEDANRNVELITEYPFSTSTKIKEELQLECSAITVRIVLHKDSIHPSKPAQKVEKTIQPHDLILPLKT
ncbi:hypothetical protein Trydic_g2170 [Trypoxylus dichotomus]